MFYIYICFVLYWANISHGANILALVAAVSYSHQIAFAPLWKELSLRGHNVTVLTTDPMNDTKLTNLTELDMKWAYNVRKNSTYLIESKVFMWNYHQTVFGAMYRICDFVLSSDIGMNLRRNEYKADLVLVEYLCPEFLAFAELYNCPKILIASMSVPSIYSDLIGDSTHSVLHPEFITAFHGKLSFRERVVSTLVNWYLYYVFNFDIFNKKQISLRRYFNSTSTIPELISDIDMMFLYVNPVIHGPKAIGPATITIGGYREDTSEEPIPSKMKKFLDEAVEGCIYVSLGTNVNSSELNQQLLKNIKDALGEIPYKVLWKFEEDVGDMPKNIETAKWMPQQKILNHPNVKLFVFQGGLQSIEESVHGEVPFVVIPFFADQYQNAKILEDKGLALVLDRTSLKKDDLKNAILKVMNDSKYRDRVKKLKQLILDSPMTGLEKAVWWTEYVIRNKGAKHLRNPVADIPFYQYYLLDIVAFLLGIIILSVTVTIIALTKLYKLTTICYLLKEKTQ
ncbi:UDP-glucuronosyltransferase 2B15-like [Anoplophora glabripennis]|uniref:UDP-glucuronosyltransferase 2B15-like n=1 Tax=Anoplophora glabripennis TaxID=217634 RepID=UPI000874B51C|nr:UDP-glucuronosyltransferase 2B15-like [Anoplophora glabripennis]